MEQLKHLQVVTPRLLIRRVEVDDLQAMFRLHSDQRVNRFIPYNTWVSEQDAVDWYDYVECRRENNFAEHWVIALKTEQRVIGSCLAFDYQSAGKQIEIGYVLDPDYWGLGYMREALQEFIAKVQGALHVGLFIAKVDPENQSSLTLLEKLGFQRCFEKSCLETIVLQKYVSD